jgi:chromosome segregation ATPase
MTSTISSPTATSQSVDTTKVSKEEVINYFESSSLRQFLQRALHNAFEQKHEQPLEVLYTMLYNELNKKELDDKREEDHKAVISELQVNFNKQLEELNNEKQRLKDESQSIKEQLTANLEDLNHQVEQLKSQLEIIQGEKEQLEKQVQKNTIQIQEKDLLIEELQKQIQQLNTDLENLKKEEEQQQEPVNNPIDE